jgi:hypothetical protein
MQWLTLPFEGIEEEVCLTLGKQAHRSTRTKCRLAAYR